MHISRARAPSSVASAAIECRLLNRKCGLICMRSACSSASRASVRASAARQRRLARASRRPARRNAIRRRAGRAGCPCRTADPGGGAVRPSTRARPHTAPVNRPLADIGRGGPGRRQHGRVGQAQRPHAADGPGRKAGKCEQDAGGSQHRRILHPGGAAGRPHQVVQQRQDRYPAGKVQQNPPAPCKYGMHRARQFLTSTPPNTAEPLMNRRFTPGMSRVGLHALIAETAEDGGHRRHHRPVLRHLEFHAAEHGGDIHHCRVTAHAGPPQIDLHAAEHRRDVAAAKIVRRHLALHTAENGVVIQLALVSSRRHIGHSCLRRRQPAPQHQQAGPDQYQRPEIAPRKVQQSHRIGKKQAAHADQDSAGELAVRVRRIHHLGQPRRDQDHRPETPDVVHVKDVQVVQQEQNPDPDHHQRRNDAWDVSLESPILVWLHEFSIGRQRRRFPWKSANTPLLPATASSRVARTALDERSSFCYEQI